MEALEEQFKSVFLEERSKILGLTFGLLLGMGFLVSSVWLLTAEKVLISFLTDGNVDKTSSSITILFTTSLLLI